MTEGPTHYRATMKGLGHVTLPMSVDDRSPSIEDIERRIQQVGHSSRFVRAGLGVIVAAFVLAVVGRLPANLDSVSSAVDAVLLPWIFVGMGLLLSGIGTHPTSCT